MRTSYSRLIIKVFFCILFLSNILFFQNCASQGSGASPFSIALGSSGTTPGALSISPISLASNQIQVGSAYSAAVTLTGADLSGISCTWSLTSGGSTIGSSVITAANSSSVCAASLVAPGTVGNYTLNVVASNVGGEVISQATSLTTQSGAPAPSYQLTISSSSPSAFLGESVTFTGTALTNISGSYTLSIGKVVSGVQAPVAGCSVSSTGTTLSFTCPIILATLGAESFYISLVQGATTVQNCTTTSPNCLGSAYTVNVINTPPPRPTPCSPTTQLGQKVFVPLCQ